MVLIVLAGGSLLLVPTLKYASTALNSLRIFRDATWTQYALDAVTQQAMWELQYDTQFQDCDGDPATIESFVECVALNGEWTLTTQPLPVGTPHTVVDKVNGQDVSVKVEVPGELIAPPAPRPVPVNDHCLYVTVTRDNSWVQVGEPITYTFTIWNCGTKNTALRRIKALLSPSFEYVPLSTTTTYPSPPLDLAPEETRCDGSATPPDPDYYPCPQSVPPIIDGALLLSWPDGTNSYKGGDEIRIDRRQTTTWSFQATPTRWGVFYVEAILCYFSSASGDPGPCTGESRTTKRSGKVAPVVVGMFNIQGKGRGYSFGASSKLDNGGSDLISIND